MAYANVFANGEELDRNEFEGGKGTTCFKILKDNGFEIVLKNESNSISETLVKFLEQAKSNSLKTKDYIRYFDDLQVKVSFGMASLARVPWISFLAHGQKTSNGIYPVYLFYKKYNILYTTLRNIIFAWKAYDNNEKLRYLRQIDVDLLILKSLITISYKYQYITQKNYMVWNEHISEIGKLVGGWIKSCQKG